MCAGAIVNSRIDRVVWGADDMVAGCCKSVINFNSYPFNHLFATASGVCEDECKAVLQEFFQTKRRSE
jgi:tRNA(adenine34) deaminase